MKEIELRNVKGTTDYSPREQYIRNYISDTLKCVFEKYGFKPLQTPLLCYYDLLALKYDEENDILKEVYKVSDQGNRNLALRYDLTVPFAKYIAINQNTKLPFKRYEIGEVFRNGPVKLGRDREFIQCDVDSVGIEGQLVEAEFIALYVEAYSKLGIDVVIKYNNRKFLSGIIIEAGISEELITDTITIIDKFEKLTKEELQKEFLKVGLNEEQIEKLSKFLKSSVVWVLGIVLTIFVGVVSLEGTLSSSVDGITAKTAKSAVSTIIPVVGKVLGDVVDSVLGCGIILKNAIGLIGVIIVIGICITPIIKI